MFVRRYLTRGEALLADLRPGPGLGHQRAEAAVEAPAAGARAAERRPPDQEAPADPGGLRGRHAGTPTTATTSSPSIAKSKMLLRIEKNKHPLKQHPVHFLVLEKDDQQPLGKSQVELLVGRQDFQDLMLNGAMKLWYRNINPSIIGYGTVNAVPNLSPGKYTQISQPERQDRGVRGEHPDADAVRPDQPAEPRHHGEPGRRPPTSRWRRQARQRDVAPRRRVSRRRPRWSTSPRTTTRRRSSRSSATTARTP